MSMSVKNQAGERDRMRDADVTLANGAMSTAITAIWAFVNICLVLFSKVGMEGIRQVQEAYGTIAVLAVLLFALCFLSFKRIYLLFGESDSVWSYLTALAADTLYLVLMEVVFLWINKP